MKKTLLLALAALLPFVAGAAVSYTGGTYLQDFSGLSTSTGAHTWTDDTTLTGWYASATLTTFSQYTTSWQTGISAGVLYHLRNTDEDEPKARFFGGRNTSGTGDIIVGFQLTNDTSQSLTSFDLSFIASQFYKTGVAQQLQVSYSTDATSLTSGTWTLLPALTFTAPYTTGNAQVSAAEEVASRTPLGVSGQTITWTPGEDLWIRFVSYRDLSGFYTGAAGVLAINNVTFTAVPEPSTIALLLGLAALGCVLVRRRMAD